MAVSDRAKLAQEVADLMTGRIKPLSVLVPTMEDANMLARSLKSLGFKASAQNALVGNAPPLALKVAPIVTVTSQRKRKVQP